MHDKISVSGLCFPEFDLADTLAAVTELGISASTLQTDVIRQDGWQKGLAQIRSSGISVPGLVGPFPKDLGNRESWSVARTDFIETLDAAAELGSRAVYSVTGPLVTDERQESLDLFVEFIAPVVAYAKEVGVLLCVEPTIPDYSWVSFVFTLDEVVELYELTGMGVCLDLYHVWNDPKLEYFLTHHLDLIGLVQVGDCVMQDGHAVKVVTGEGIIPLPNVLAQVVASGYDGVFDIEQFGPRMEDEGLIPSARRAVFNVEKAFVPVQHA